MQSNTDLGTDWVETDLLISGIRAGRIRMGIDGAVVTWERRNGPQGDVMRMAELGMFSSLTLKPNYEASSSRDVNEPINPDEFINKWATELGRIYENDTVGDYTFVGVVHKILMELKGRDF